MVALVLALMAPRNQTDIIKQMPWSVLIMIIGIMTYVGVMEKIGAMDYMTELITGFDNPMLSYPLELHQVS